MTAAQQSMVEKRGATRYAIDFSLIGEHRRVGNVHLHIMNLSAHGFMAGRISGVGRGERIAISLPIIGRIEAHQIWSTDDRAGFQFERILRANDFLQLIGTLQDNPRPRGLTGLR